MAERPDDARPLVIVPARFSATASALRYRAEVAARKLLAAIWDAGGEPLVVQPHHTGTFHRRPFAPALDGRCGPAAWRR
jgi:hypothetical protein